MSELEELQGLLERQSIQKGDFVLASGARSHYYCDTKATVLTPRGAFLCGRLLYHLLRDRRVEAVGGMAIGATYLATAITIASDLAAQVEASAPRICGFAVRPQNKDHGTQQRIDQSWSAEGPLLRPGRRVALIDDVVTTAGSTLRALDAVVATGAVVVAVAAVVDRQAGGAERFRERGLDFAALFRADSNGDLSPAPGFEALLGTSP